MITIDDIRKPIKADLQAFDEFVADNFKGEGDLLQEMLLYALKSRGKGVRPMLTILSASMNNPSLAEASAECGEERRCTKRTYLAAMITEMIHTASLIHDDILDSADERRGIPSVNSKWGSNLAVILGDYILANTVGKGMASGQYDIVAHIGPAIGALCEGEVLQGQHAMSLDTTRDDYFDIISLKTASLLGTSAALGAISVGAPRERVDRMRKFGEAVGIAFQIQDDILDFVRNNNTGKPANNDLREHKITLPMLEVMERSTPAEREEMLSLLRRCGQDESAVDALHHRVVEGRGLELAAETMQAYLQRAMHHLSHYDASPYRDALLAMCRFIAERDR